MDPELEKVKTRVENLETDRIEMEERIASLEKHVVNLLSDLLERRKAAK